MSRETLHWLNTNTLIGFTDKRGHASHWRAHEQDGTRQPLPRPDPGHRRSGPAVRLVRREPPAGHRGRGRHALHDPPV